MSQQVGGHRVSSSTSLGSKPFHSQPGSEAGVSDGTLSNGRAACGFLAVVDALRETKGWSLKEQIGRGGSAVVYREHINGIARAVKITLDPIENNASMASRQAEALDLLRLVGSHPHVLTLISYEFVLRHLVTVWELAEEGTLLDRLRLYQQNGHRGIPLDELLGYMKQAAEGIEFLNTRGICHRDIKPANLFLTGGQVKVGDLGLLKPVGLSCASHSGVGTSGYTPPEAFHPEGKRLLHPSIDVYSLAATYVHLRTGRPPFGEGLSSLQRQLNGSFCTDGLFACEIECLRSALSPHPHLRPRSAEDFVRGLIARLGDTPGYARIPVAEPVDENDFPEEDVLEVPAVSRIYVPAAAEVLGSVAGAISGDRQRARCG